MNAKAIGHRRIGGFCLIGALVLVAGPATRIRSAEDVDLAGAAHDAANTPTAVPRGEAVDQVANEILQLRQSIGSAWREDAIAESVPPAESTVREMVRTALLAQARAAAEASLPIRSHSDYGQQAALREAAHQLDLTAHLLECRELYPQADDVRDMADRFRRDAREALRPPLRVQGDHNTSSGGRQAD